MGAVTNLVIVRHGATAFTEAGKLCGGSDPIDPPLSETGNAQAAGAAKLVAAIGSKFMTDLDPAEVLYTSPVQRASELANHIALTTALTPIVAEPLREINIGAGFNAQMSELFAKYPNLFADWIAGVHHWEGLESLTEMVDRIAPFVDTLWSRHYGQTVILACHEVVTRVILGACLGWSARDVLRLQVPLGSTQVLQRGADGHISLLCASLDPQLGDALAA